MVEGNERFVLRNGTARTEERTACTEERTLVLWNANGLDWGITGSALRMTEIAPGMNGLDSGISEMSLLSSNQYYGGGFYKIFLDFYPFF